MTIYVSSTLGLRLIYKNYLLWSLVCKTWVSERERERECCTLCEDGAEEEQKVWVWWRWKHVRNGDEKWWVLAKAKDYNIEKYNSRKPGLSIIMGPTYVRVGGWVVVGCWSKITGISGTNFWNRTVSVAAITRRALKGALQNNCVDWVDQRYLRFIHTVLFWFNRRKPSAPTALLDIITSHTATSCCCWHSTQLLWLVGGWVVTLAAYMTHLGEGFVVFKFKRMADSLPSYIIWVIWWSAHRRLANAFPPWTSSLIAVVDWLVGWCE